jgi:hypothetical protein
VGRQKQTGFLARRERVTFQVRNFNWSFQLQMGMRLKKLLQQKFKVEKWLGVTMPTTAHPSMLCTPLSRAGMCLEYLLAGKNY